MEIGCRTSLRRRGFTLIELVIYFGLSAMALGVLVSMFIIASRTQQQTYSQYLVGGSLSSTVHLIRRELQATALSSIKVYSDGTPGFSCASAYDSEGNFTVNGYGAPHWQKHVFYNLGSNGSLSRWSKDMPDPNFLPSLTNELPSNLGSEGRPIMAGMLPANKAVGDIFPGSPSGGLEVSFVRRENGVDSLSKVNPAESKDYDKHTRLVEVTIRTFEDHSRPDFSELTFRVCPRY